MFGGCMEEEELCELGRHYHVVSQDENTLFQQVINNNKDGHEFRRQRGLFDEIH